MATAAVDPAAAAAKPAKKGGILPMLIIGVVAAAAAGGGVFFMTKPKSAAGGEHAAAAEHGAAPAAEHGAEGGEHGGAEGGAVPAGVAQYLPITPSIVVNINDEVTLRFLSVDLELMARSTSAIDAAKLHMPRIRNTLLMLFTQQKYEDMITRDGKEALQKASLAAVQGVLKEETGATQVEGLFFTNFVMQ